MRTLVVHCKQLMSHICDVNAEFLEQLPACRVRVRFASFALAPRKFPKAPVTLVRRALADEVLVALPGDGRQDANCRRVRFVH